MEIKPIVSDLQQQVKELIEGRKKDKLQIEALKTKVKTLQETEETLVNKIDEKVDPVEQRLVPIEATIRSINYECEFTPCKNNGVCTSSMGKWACACKTGYTGDQCQLPATNCQWSGWSGWTTCNKSCGGGKKLRSRSIEIQALNGGIECTGFATDEAPCNTNTCPPHLQFWTKK